MASDAGYRGVVKRDEYEEREPDWLLPRILTSAKLAKSDPLVRTERIKASARAKVEHVFYIKYVFGYSKARYRASVKNANRLNMLANLTKLLRMKLCLPHQGQSACDVSKW